MTALLDLSMKGRVAVVTGGGHGIGSAVAIELARNGATVVVLDPGRTVRGDPESPDGARDTVERIRGLGGVAEHAEVSVTDRLAIAETLAGVAERHGSLDAVVHAAGTLRLPRLVDTVDDDWTSVIETHFYGYLNVLSAALPLMNRAGYGRIIGFTSGVGLSRTIIDGPSYGCAKRAIASLTWQLARHAPAGVTINALSPIAATRMVREMLMAGGRNTAGLDLSGMTQPEEVAPTAVYLVSEQIGWCTGQVLFSVGSEMSLNAPRRLIEAVRVKDVLSPDHALATVIPDILAPAESAQRTQGGYHPRIGPVFDQQPGAAQGTGGHAAHHCLIAGQEPEVTGALERDLASAGLVTSRPEPGQSPDLFSSAVQALRRSHDVHGPLDSVVVARRYRPGAADGDETWIRLVASHCGVSEHVVWHAAWLRAATRYALEEQRPIRVVHVTLADEPGGDTAAQMVTQLARCANETPNEHSVTAFSIAAPPPGGASPDSLGALITRLVGADDAAGLGGAELVLRDGWLGLYSHPGPTSTVACGSSRPPDWIDDWFRAAVAANNPLCLVPDMPCA
jgi:NAD(P)-dependent dehydrogenase (short-subunit alcohol dehydrogenase family)